MQLNSLLTAKVDFSRPDEIELVLEQLLNLADVLRVREYEGQTMHIAEIRFASFVFTLLVTYHISIRYRSMNCNIDIVDPSSGEYANILKQTGFSVAVKNIFKINRKVEQDQFTASIYVLQVII